MKAIGVISLIALAGMIASCGSKEKKAENDSLQEIVSMVDAVDSAQTADAAAEAESPEAQSGADKKMIVNVYETYVFGYSDADPAPYFTERALKKLRDAYDYDCETGNCYGYWELRTGAQDGDGASQVLGIDNVAPNVYVVKYTDMGLNGQTRIETLGGKIDDFQRIN